MDNSFEQSQDYINLKSKLLDYLSTRDYSVKKLAQKIASLKERYPDSKRYLNYTPANTALAIKRLIDAGLIDEERFLRTMLMSAADGTYGLRRIRLKMMRQLYPAGLIERIMKEYVENGAQPDLSKITKLAQRKKLFLENKYRSDAKQLRTVRQRLVQFLALRGYDFEIIKKILEEA